MNELARFPCYECTVFKFCQVGWCRRDICSDCLPVHFEKCQPCRNRHFQYAPPKVDRGAHRKGRR